VYIDHMLEWSAQKYSALECQILMTQWVGEAWESIQKELQLTIQPSAELPLLLMDLKMIK